MSLPKMAYPATARFSWTTGLVVAGLLLAPRTADAFQFQPINDPNLLKPFQVTKEVTGVVAAAEDEIASTAGTRTSPATPPTMAAAIQSQAAAAPEPAAPRQAVRHKKWGVDNAHANEYWNDRRIHTLGNVGLGGAFHAAVAPLSTKIIDVAAYGGMDIRRVVADDLRRRIKKTNARIVDLCCGVGTSTRTLQKAFPDAATVIGMDASPEMVSMACFLSQHKSQLEPLLERLGRKFAAPRRRTSEAVARAAPCAGAGTDARAVFLQGNAEDTRLATRSFDLVTIMYAFHEAPRDGRQRMLHEARRLLAPGGLLAIVDISHDYEPSESMLAGEPYVLEYQKNIHRQLRVMKGFCPGFTSYKSLVPGRAGVWLLKRSSSAFA